MSDTDADVVLAEQFATERPRLLSVAQRILGNRTEAEDAVQEGWLRASRADRSEIRNLPAWLTTIVSRVCLTQLESRRTRREEPLDAVREPTVPYDPERDAIRADAVGDALAVVLETLSPPERLAFVLHDLFGLPFGEIADIVGRSPAATRQLASRARRRVQGAAPDGTPDRDRQRRIVDAFLDAARGGDLTTLLALLAPGIVMRADESAVAVGSIPEIRGADAVAALFSGGGARAAFPALVDGEPGLVWQHRGVARVLFRVTVDEGVITGIDLSADPEALSRFERDRSR